MYPGGYTAEVTCLSPKANEKEVYDFFVHCGTIEFVEIIRLVRIFPLILDSFISVDFLIRCGEDDFLMLRE